MTDEWIVRCPICYDIIDMEDGQACHCEEDLITEEMLDRAINTVAKELIKEGDI